MIPGSFISGRRALLLLALLLLLPAGCSQFSRPWGDVRIAAGAPIRIGLLTDVDGPDAAPALRAALSVDGHPIQIVPVAVHCHSYGAASAPGPAALDGLAGVIGSGCSSACIYAESLLFEQKTTLVAAGCTAQAVVQSSYPIAFRVAWNDADQAIVAARYARSTLHAAIVALVSDRTAYARVLLATYAGESKRLGGGSIAEIDVPEAGDEDVADVAAQVRVTGAQAVLLAMSRPDAADLFAQLQATLPDRAVIATDTVFAPTSVGVSPSGLVTVGLARDAGGWRSELDPGPLSPDLFAAQTTDAVDLYARAIAEVARRGQDGSLTIPRQALRDAIADTKMSGDTGRIDFGPTGERRHDVGAALYRLDAGQPVQLQVYER